MTFIAVTTTRGLPADQLAPCIDSAVELLRSQASAIQLRNHDSSCRLIDSALEQVASLHGDRSAAMIQALTEAGNLLVGTGDFRAAHRYVEQACAMSRELYGAVHRETAYAIQDLAVVLNGLDHDEAHDEAESLLREALAIRREVLPSDHPELAGSKALLSEYLVRCWGRSEQKSGNLHLIDEAEQLTKRALSILEPGRGANDPDVQNLRLTLLDCAAAREDYSALEQLARSCASVPMPEQRRAGPFEDYLPSDFLQLARACH